VLTHEQHSDTAGKPANDLVGGVDNVPLGFDFARLGHVGFHVFRSMRAAARVGAAAGLARLLF
jgi:hypothetical protein